MHSFACHFAYIIYTCRCTFTASNMTIVDWPFCGINIGIQGTTRNHKGQAKQSYSSKHITNDIFILCRSIIDIPILRRKDPKLLTGCMTLPRVATDPASIKELIPARKEPTNIYWVRLTVIQIVSTTFTEAHSHVRYASKYAKPRRCISMDRL